MKRSCVQVVRVISILFFIQSFIISTISSYGKDNKLSTEMIQPPQFQFLGSTKNNGILKMECEGQGPNYPTIDCSFTQLFIIKKTETDINKLKSERNLQNKKMTKKDFIEIKDIFSKDIINDERIVLLESMTPEKKKYNDRIVKYVDDINKSENLSELIIITDEFSEYEDKCCLFVLHTWKEKYERISKLKWISNPGPKGLCNVVSVGTIESYDDSYLLWKYTQIVASIDFDKKKKDLSNKYCSGVEINKPVIYSWDIPTKSEMDCKCIKYSW